MNMERARLEGNLVAKVKRMPKEGYTADHCSCRPDLWWITRPGSDNTWAVYLHPFHCGCPVFQKHQLCHHILYALQLEEEEKWQRLAIEYEDLAANAEHPRLGMDHEDNWSFQSGGVSK